MREILFKAKRADNGEWVTGYYIKSIVDGSVFGYIRESIFGTDIKIMLNTICQYTGLNDKNGKLIWENDVVRFKHEKFDFDYGLEPWERSCFPNKKEYTRNYSVEFCNTSTNYGLRFRNKSIWFMVHRMTVVMHDVEVIGNIFDNPELMHE